MKAYIVSGAEDGVSNIDGIYTLVTADGIGWYSHWCSHKGFARGDLLEHRPERIKQLNDKYGEIELLYLGEDDMTLKKIVKLNKQYKKDNNKE